MRRRNILLEIYVSINKVSNTKNKNAERGGDMSGAAARTGEKKKKC